MISSRLQEVASKFWARSSHAKSDHDPRADARYGCSRYILIAYADIDILTSHIAYPDIAYPDIAYPDIAYPDIAYPDIAYAG
jgi:hypothetical protein